MDLNRLKLSQIDTSDIASSEFASSNSVNLVQDNVAALPDSAANDYATYTTLTGLIDTVQDNVAALDNNVWVNANDYTTYSTLSSLVNTVQSNVDALPDSAANDYATYTTVTANTYNTYNTLSGLIDTVQDNVGTASSNTQTYIGENLLSNTALLFTAGDGVSLTANTTIGEVSFAVQMGNVTSQTMALDGTANSFTLVKSVANNNMVFVIYNGLVQDPSRYEVSGTTLTLANDEPVVAGANLEVRYFDFFSLPGSSSGGGGGYTFQGSNYGYASGGDPDTNVIEKFSFTSDGNAADVGDLTYSWKDATGQSSSSHGYISGGIQIGLPPTYPKNKVDKFSFSVDGNSTAVGDLTVDHRNPAGQSSSTSGYTSGGEATTNVIDKFPFSSDANAADVGDLTVQRHSLSGQSSSTHGYNSGGFTPTVSNVIDKFPFSADANATDVGDLTQTKGRAGDHSSTSHGYISGGANPTFVNVIEKFSFTSDGNATDVGDITVTRAYITGTSSTASGYSHGGWAPGASNVIDKFPFAADGNASDVGDLTAAKYNSAGQQY